MSRQEMEIIAIKFDNFVDFVKKNIQNSTYVSLLGSVNVNIFLTSLEPHKNKTPSEITQIVCDKFGINKKDYSDDIIKKFERYVEYFSKVCKTIK